jgi:arabinan endo-1,5-alpha-L-arabinosidase
MSWVREPASAGYAVSGETFDFYTQPADLFVDSNNASVLLETAPSENYIVEAKVKLNLPPEGCCFNYVQAGLVIYGDDNNFIKLVHVSIWDTRQTEFAKELAPVPDGYPRYGNTVVGAPDEWTYLRIVRRTNKEGELYTAYTSTDGVNWVRGGTWTHQLGSSAHIGLISMGGSGFTANFDYVRVYILDD